MALIWTYGSKGTKKLTVTATLSLSMTTRFTRDQQALLCHTPQQLIGAAYGYFENLRRVSLAKTVFGKCGKQPLLVCDTNGFTVGCFTVGCILPVTVIHIRDANEEAAVHNRYFRLPGTALISAKNTGDTRAERLYDIQSVKDSRQFFISRN
jgi:hypothetical protein